jgi:hypothetical protein
MKLKKCTPHWHNFCSEYGEIKSNGSIEYAFNGKEPNHREKEISQI